MTTTLNIFKSGNIEIYYESSSDDISISYEKGQYYDESGRVSMTSEFNDFEIENKITEVYLTEDNNEWTDVDEMNTPLFRALVKQHFEENYQVIVNELIENYLN